MRTAQSAQPVFSYTVKPAQPKVDGFHALLDDALEQVDHRVCVEVRWLANLGLAVEAERLLIDYLVSDTRRFEVEAEREVLTAKNRIDNLLFAVWICRIVDFNVLGTFAGCMAWVMMGS